MTFYYPEFGLYLSDYKVAKKVERINKPYKPTIQKSVVIKQPSLTRRLMPANKIRRDER